VQLGEEMGKRYLERDEGYPFVMPPVCDNYIEDADPDFKGICATCSHKKGCHK